jgi:hypothetical protein
LNPDEIHRLRSPGAITPMSKVILFIILKIILT